MNGILRRLRGVIGNAVAWGLAWFGAAAAFMSILYLGGYEHPLLAWGFVFQSAVGAGVAGFLTGAAFSAYIRLAYYGRNLLEIGGSRFAFGGAAVAGVLGGLVGGGIVAPAMIGAATAAGTIKLAKNASALPKGPETDPVGMIGPG